MSGANESARVVRVVFKEIVTGDRRKFFAQSNDAKTGGGARDLRFSPASTFKAAFERMCPNTTTEMRKRKKQMVQTTVRIGTMAWSDAAGPHTQEFSVESPTDARGFEWRIATVHKYPPLRQNLAPESERTVLLLIQREDGNIWPHFATEDELRLPDWDEDVASPILQALEETAEIGPAGTRKNIAKGYIELEEPK